VQKILQSSVFITANTQKLTSFVVQWPEFLATENVVLGLIPVSGMGVFG
jgi:hypothetical protein